MLDSYLEVFEPELAEPESLDGWMYKAECEAEQHNGCGCFGYFELMIQPVEPHRVNGKVGDWTVARDILHTPPNAWARLWAWGEEFDPDEDEYVRTWRSAYLSIHQPAQPRLPI